MAHGLNRRVAAKLPGDGGIERLNDDTILMSGGEAMVRAAVKNGTETVFGLPGAQTYPLFDALHRTGLNVLVPRHEQTAGYMAMGYAKSSGRTGVFTVVPGPGVLNSAAALCTAMGNCSALVCLTGQVPSEYMGKGRGHLHELLDQRGTLKTIIKDALRADSPAAAPATVNQAFRIAQSGRPGPVAVEMCWDTMAQRGDVRIGPSLAPAAPPEPDPDAVAQAVSALATAHNPMIMCGAGAQDASEAVIALAELLQAPVTAFRSGRGVVPEDHPLAAPPVAARALWDDVDVLLGVGSRLEMPYMRWRSAMHYEARPSYGPKLVRLDIDPLEMSRLVPDIALVTDAALGCRLLVDGLKNSKLAARPDRAAAVARENRRARALFEAQMQPQTAFLDVLRAVLPRDGFLVPELSQMGFASYTGAFPVLAPRTYVTEGFQGTLGFGFPTALGVKVAHPNKAVVAMTGDGGFQFALAELATAAQYGIAVVIVLFNNRAYGNVLRDQQQQFDGRVIGARLQNPDFVRLAESFEVTGRRVTTPRQLRDTLEQGLALGAPMLIEVDVPPGSEASPWKFIHMTSYPDA
jgi:acetolactate synthase-1/2/3 large subunit